MLYQQTTRNSSCWVLECRLSAISRLWVFPAHISLVEICKIHRLLKTMVCCKDPVAPPIKAQIVWEYILWDFHQSPDLLGVRILGRSKAQIPKMPPHQNQSLDRLGTSILELSRAQTPKMPYSPLLTPSQLRPIPLSEPNLRGSTYFGTFRGPRSQNVCSQLLPPSKRRSLGDTHFGLSRAQTKTPNSWMENMRMKL